LKKYYLIILLVLISTHIFGQDLTDSVIYVPIKDSLLTKDTTKSKGDLDAIVDYSAKDSAIFDLTGDKLFLYNEGHLKFKEYDLKAARIILFQESSIMEANGVPDTVKAGKYMGTPVFMEGTKRYDAFKLRYNFKNRQGNIEMGSTELEGGFYMGEKIKKVDEDIFFIQNGRYTTCDKTDPDFYFSSPKMKVLQGDKIIAEPVFLCVDDVPVFAIPFGVFPNHSGRSSGIIPPAYGEDATYGKYLAHLGYFWATNDFMDVALQGNYYTKGRYDLSARYRYVIRYILSGSVDIGGSRLRLGEENDFDRNFSDEWQIAVSHNQTINPTTNLTADVNFLSSKNYYTNSTNSIPDLLRQNAISNITLSKYWEGTPISATVNYHRDQNLTSGEVSQVIPNISFAISQSYPFRGKNTSQLNLRWYEQVSYTYNANLLYNDNKTLVDPSQNNGDFKKNSRGGIRQSVLLNAPIKLSEFSLVPSFSYNEVWYNKSITKTFNPADSTVTINDVTGFKTYRTFSTSLTLNTRLVGLFKTNIFGVKGFRHIVTPAVSFSYTPDFSKPTWNYYGSYTDQYGRNIPYSYFEREVFGSPGSGEQQTMTFSVGNVFEMKVKDTDTTDKKFQLLNLSAGINYNFAADSLKYSELGLNFRTDVGDYLGIGGGASFNLYKYVDGVGRVNKFLWNEEKRLAQLTSFNINVSTTLQSGQSEITPADSLKSTKTENEYSGVFGDRPFDYSIPWSINLNYNYSINRSIPSLVTKSSNISANLNFSLTKNWRFTLTSAFDIFQKQFASPFVTIYRDLHCWEFSLNWTPLGTYRGYKFELHIKASQLQDIKLNKQSNYRGVY
jgi:lipopolysaccharide assembly outer membrane protein LptD (OstA)